MLSIALGRTTRLMPIASSEQPSGEADQIDTGDNMYACSVGKVSRKNELALVCNTLIIAGLMAKISGGCRVSS